MKKVLGHEANQLVHILRQQLFMRFFILQDETRSLLESVPVLMSVSVSPAGAKLFKAVSRMLGQFRVYERTVGEVRAVCDRLKEPSTTGNANAMPSVQVTPRTQRALSSLPDFTDDEDSVGGKEVVSSKAALSNDHMEERLQAVAGSKTKDPLVFGAEEKRRFPTFYLVACSVLGAVASSAAFERYFLVAGHIMRKDRGALLSRHLEIPNRHEGDCEIHILCRGRAEAFS